MAFDKKGLSLMPNPGCFANPGTNTAMPFRIAAYITPDTAALVEAANYFNGGASGPALQKGTVINATMACNATPVFKKYIVTGNDGATVTIALQTTTAG